MLVKNQEEFMLLMIVAIVENVLMESQNFHPTDIIHSLDDKRQCQELTEEFYVQDASVTGILITYCRIIRAFLIE
jgi:hypothetical protein